MSAANNNKNNNKLTRGSSDLPSLTRAACRQHPIIGIQHHHAPLIIFITQPLYCRLGPAISVVWLLAVESVLRDAIVTCRTSDFTSYNVTQGPNFFVMTRLQQNQVTD